MLLGMSRLIGSLAALAAVLLLAGCGSSATPLQAEAARPDDAFVVRLARHQQTSLALSRSAAADARELSVRRLARRMVASRERSLPGLMERLADVRTQESLPDLGVSQTQAAEGIGPDALKGAQPLDIAFLTLMSAHNRRAIALARAELSRGRDPAVKAVAERVAADAAGELGQLSDALSEQSATG
jgi:uncharacterized protein (DUF305 family)